MAWMPVQTSSPQLISEVTLSEPGYSKLTVIDAAGP
jgi:hypothetical protein